MKLDVVLVDNSELSFNVSKETFTVGRSPQCDVVIPHEGMSRKHCQITYKDGDLYIEDLGSVNGVLIDGKKIEPNTPTKFQIFLNVTFGAVQNLKIELDDVTKVTTLPGSIAATTSSAHTGSTQTATKLALANNKTGKIKKPSQMDSSGPKKVAKEEKKSNSMIVILILVAVVGFAAYFFMGQEEIPSGPTPEQIYE